MQGAPNEPCENLWRFQIAPLPICPALKNPGPNQKVTAITGASGRILPYCGLAKQDLIVVCHVLARYLSSTSSSQGRLLPPNAGWHGLLSAMPRLDEPSYAGLSQPWPHQALSRSEGQPSISMHILSIFLAACIETWAEPHHQPDQLPIKGALQVPVGCDFVCSAGWAQHIPSAEHHPVIQNDLPFK